MFSSLKSQLTILLTVILILFIGQEYISYQSQAILSSGLISNQEIAEGVVQVKNLEKEVLDLQRNVLIYKENSASSVLKRINNIMVAINHKLDMTTLFIQKNHIASEQEVAIESMRSHLKDYRDNFDSVVLLMAKKDELFNEKIVVKLMNLKKTTSEISQSFKKSKIIEVIATPEKEHEDLYNLASELQLAAYQYFLLPSTESIAHLNSTIDQIKPIIKAFNNDELQSELNVISSDFALLTQVTRNYHYLVNVVMSGSANEFLYLAKNLSNVVLQHLSISNSQLDATIEESTFRGNIMFTLGISLTSIIIIYILQRLIVPIQQVTKVFDTLSENKKVNQSLDVTRGDEVGKLMKSASIFQLKNKQTNDLLIQSQQLNEQLALSQEKAEKATQSKSIFLANMSHEIRTPMNGIIGLTDLLSLKKLDEEGREYVDKIRYSSNILMSVINDILDFSKIEAGKIDIEQVLFEPIEIFENVIEAITIKADEKNINIRCLISKDIPKQLNGDPVRLSQILLNLGNNAVKFTHTGSVTFTIKITIKSDEYAALMVEVCDTGIGISDTQQKNIFKDFTQADNSTSRNFGGTGLGLSISKQLVELMGGEISCTSILNQGSTFCVSIPFKLTSPPTSHLPPASTKNKLFIWNIGDFVSPIIDNLAPYFANIEQIKTTNNLIEERDWKPTEALVINISGKLSPKQFTNIIELLKKTTNIGFCCDVYALTARAAINKFTQQPAIHHPLLPGKLKTFTHALFKSVHDKKHKTSQAPQINTPPQFKGHVLIVDDNAINQIVARKMLTSFGLTYDIAEDGQQAVTKVKNSPEYDLIFMDIQMPIMDGYEATSAIRAAGLDKIIICGLSANAMQSDIEKGKSSGMNDYITKPISQKDVQKILHKYLK